MNNSDKLDNISSSNFVEKIAAFVCKKLLNESDEDLEIIQKQSTYDETVLSVKYTLEDLSKMFEGIYTEYVDILTSNNTERAKIKHMTVKSEEILNGSFFTRATTICKSLDSFLDELKEIRESNKNDYHTERMTDIYATANIFVKNELDYFMKLDNYILDECNDDIKIYTIHTNLKLKLFNILV